MYLLFAGKIMLSVSVDSEDEAMDADIESTEPLDDSAWS
jgi:hypothetical protein